MQGESWPSVAVLGAGAVGCYFGGMLARAGAPVTLIGRPHHVEALARDGLWLESLHFQERIPIAAWTMLDAIRDAALVLLSVKTLDTEEAAKSLVPYLSSDKIVVSFQNGVDNVERIRAATGLEALAAVVYVAVAMAGPGHVKHTGRGDLIVGDWWGGRRSDLERLAALFTRAGVRCVVSNDIQADLWTKMAMNCAYNAISALGRARYGRIVKDPWARELLPQVIKEVSAVARASGVQLRTDELVEAGLQLGEAMPEALSSTAQDIGRGKRTEIDSLNGYVARQGKELGVPTPVNQTLHALVKLLEESLVGPSARSEEKD